MASRASSNVGSAAPIDSADKAEALRLCPVSRETGRRLDDFAALLHDWNARTNLVAPSTLPKLWTRHIADSLQLLRVGNTAGLWVDLGSGAGFPGVVLACALTGSGHVHLVERNAKKAAFLREALRVTGAAGTVHHADIVDFVERFAEPADYVTARALAPLNVLIQMSAPLLDRGARGLFPKGQDVEAELTEAAKYWTIQFKLHPSLTQAGSAIVDIISAAKLAKRGES